MVGPMTLLFLVYIGWAQWKGKGTSLEAYALADRSLPAAVVTMGLLVVAMNNHGLHTINGIVHTGLVSSIYWFFVLLFFAFVVFFTS